MLYIIQINQNPMLQTTYKSWINNAEMTLQHLSAFFCCFHVLYFLLKKKKISILAGIKLIMKTILIGVTGFSQLGSELKMDYMDNNSSFASLFWIKKM